MLWYGWCTLAAQNRALTPDRCPVAALLPNVIVGRPAFFSVGEAFGLMRFSGTGSDVQLSLLQPQHRQRLFGICWNLLRTAAGQDDCTTQRQPVANDARDAV